MGLLIETSNSYARDVITGVSSYIHTHDCRWSVFLENANVHLPPPDWLKTWDGDGILCRWTNPEYVRLFRLHGLPAIDLNDHFGFLGIPHVGSDMETIGRAAAEHLLQREFEHIAFCGFEGAAWSERRQAGVEAAIHGRAQFRGAFNSTVPFKQKDHWEQDRDRIARWIGALPRPVGIVACNDMRGYQILDAVRMLDLAVPEEIAVIGVDDDPTYCGIASPPLSSVRTNAQRIGYEAATLLDRLMSGKKVADRAYLVPPIEVVLRQSTDVTAVSDPLTARALRLIREHACDGWTVEDLLTALKTTRTSLEKRFRKSVGIPPHAQILRVRLSRVKRLLLATDWTLERIAEETGYTRSGYMTVQFTRLVGCPPSKWRTQNRIKDPLRR